MMPGIDHPLHPAAHARTDAGFTVLELAIVVALLVTVSAIAIPMYLEALNAARIVRSQGDIKSISTAIDTLFLRTGNYPDTLAEVGFDRTTDPWGNSYQYLKIVGLHGKGQVRKDKNLVPINSDYDLYSMGRDGETTTPLTAKNSRDDVIRANNGAFIGLAADY